MKLLACFLPALPLFADVAPAAIFGPIVLVLLVPVLLIVAGVVLHRALTKTAPRKDKTDQPPEDDGQQKP